MTEDDLLSSRLGEGADGRTEQGKDDESDAGSMDDDRYKEKQIVKR